MTKQKLFCECCRKPLHKSEAAAQVFAGLPTVTRSWCFECWDNDPRALAQYQTHGVPTADYRRARDSAHIEV